MSTFLDPVTRRHIDRELQDLYAEFRGTFSEETIDRYVNDTLDRFSDSRVLAFLPVFVHRFVRERLRALAQTEGKLIKTVPEVLFVCVHNAGRSQMAAALLNALGAGRVHVRSAGSDPTDRINPAVVQALDEVGLDISQEFPKPLTDEVVTAADAVITMGCGDACPIYPGKRYEDWLVDDPADKGLDDVRRIRDEIEGRVRVLLADLLSEAP